MTTRGKITTAVIVIVILVAAFVLWSFGWVVLGAIQAGNARTRLLCKTDHQALLNAGRDLLDRVPKPEARTPDGWSIVDLISIPENTRLPQVISRIDAMLKKNKYRKESGPQPKKEP